MSAELALSFAFALKVFIFHAKTPCPKTRGFNK